MYEQTILLLQFDQIQKAQRTIDALAQQVSPEQRALLEQTQGIKPFPNAAGASLIPGYTMKY